MYQNVPYKRVFVTIDLDAIVFNMESMKQNIKPGTEMMGVVKADGYGRNRRGTGDRRSGQWPAGGPGALSLYFI